MGNINYKYKYFQTFTLKSIYHFYCLKQVLLGAGDVQGDFCSCRGPSLSPAMSHMARNCLCFQFQRSNMFLWLPQVLMCMWCTCTLKNLFKTKKMATHKCCLIPSSKKLLFETDREHCRKPQSITMQSLGARSQRGISTKQSCT